MVRPFLHSPRPTSDDSVTIIREDRSGGTRLGLVRRSALGDEDLANHEDNFVDSSWTQRVTLLSVFIACGQLAIVALGLKRFRTKASRRWFFSLSLTLSFSFTLYRCLVW